MGCRGNSNSASFNRMGGNRWSYLTLAFRVRMDTFSNQPLVHLYNFGVSCKDPIRAVLGAQHLQSSVDINTSPGVLVLRWRTPKG